jgi:radical SAM superfamily enzyme YgiQ (UPF0313 family)
MRVLLISANRSKVNMPTVPLGLACVAAAAQEAGHTVELLDLMEAEEASSALADTVSLFQPEVIGISIRNIDDQNMRHPEVLLDDDIRVIEQAKKLSDVPVVLGGAGYSMFPEALLARTGADIGVQGEGEEAFKLLLERLEKGASPAGPGIYLHGEGLQGNRTFVRDLDSLPLPGPDLLSKSLAAKDIVLPVQTRRGCPMACSYCSTAVIEGGTIRRRSPAKVVEWLAGASRGDVHQLYFVDNTFNLPASYARSLCNEMTRARLGAAWRCIIYPLKMDDALAAAMAEAGCTEASVGFESGCDAILHSMNKRFRREDVVQTCTILRKHGIRCMGFLLLGTPGETRDSIEESLAFADSLRLDALKVTIGIRIYPDTPLADQARKEGSIAPEDDLVTPRFYMPSQLEDWARERVAVYAERRPNWVVDVAP